MDNQLILEVSQRTLQGTLSFPDAVKSLLAGGVEFYHVDYITLQKTFYGANGAAAVTPLLFENLPPVADEFDATALQAAILDSQRNGQQFRDFSPRAMRAGVQGYFAFLRGQRVTYLGRQGDQHTEWFPGAKPAGI